MESAMARWLKLFFFFSLSICLEENLKADLQRPPDSSLQLKDSLQREVSSEVQRLASLIRK